MSDSLQLDVKNNIARLSLRRPEKRNALNQAMWQVLPEFLEQAATDPSVKILVLCSYVPGVFCAGADIEEFATCAHDRQWRRQNQAAIREAQFQLARFPKPTIAEISGVCVGGGCGLALACDLRIASDMARLGITPARLGLVYSLHDTKLLVDLVGPAWAKRILYAGQLITARDALAIGLVDQVAPEAQTSQIVEELAQSIAVNSQHSVRAAKTMVRMILDGTLDDTAETMQQFDSAFDGPDYQEGVSAFLERRRPAFPTR